MKIEDWTNKIHNGHVVDILKEMPSRSIDVAVTSPPYWGLRDYGDITKVKWDKWEGQLGLEPHPQMYIDHLVTIFREVKRVLKDSGSFWLNLGDTYCGGDTHHGKWKEAGKHKLSKGKDYMSGIELQSASGLNMNGKWLQPKQKMLIPERVAIALQEDGWILRNDIIWYKPNHMPSSVKDRLTSSYEHVFLFVKSRKYYFDLDSIRVPLKISSLKRLSQDLTKQHGGSKEKAYVKDNIIPAGGDIKTPSKILKRMKANPKNKNPGDMWTINTKPFKGAHFAVFPTTLIERILKCACPKEICSQCSEIRKRILEKAGQFQRRWSTKNKKDSPYNKQDSYQNIYETVGWTKCNCGVEFKGGIVLDTFIGSGTTGVVAKQLGLNFIGIELNPKYCKIASKRIGNIPIVKFEKKKVIKKEEKKVNWEKMFDVST